MVSKSDYFCRCFHGRARPEAILYIYPEKVFHDDFSLAVFDLL